MTDDDNRSSPVLKIDASDIPADLRWNVEQRKEIRRDLIPFHSLRKSSSGQIGVPPTNGSDVLQRRALLCPIPKVAGSSVHARGIFLGNGFPDLNHTIKIRQRKRPKHESIHIAENRRIRANAQRQSNDGKDSEARVLAQHAQSVKEI